MVWKEVAPGQYVKDPGDLTFKEEAEALKEENKFLKAQLKAQGDRSDFIEDCIAEMATVVYSGV